ncbi:peptidoglycan D,D-transpeptidase FtsI family protein [Helicobacter ailurogastricus]|uniref:Cell division protein FtsI [Peptidoglycan synthetase] n=1 Tax=Helicobacter ailurogastricus TaxID=1578720 RepID=A0A0K2X3X1_9HELI|nr:Cell division protein FtsI [Peptidoglycan synthetase] [Helicobacter ailurogastricus]CRF42427.1 Cell division protein FtsI [Peptidoglycan synthetase] [Helicobacter ailurogastricus]CRF44831.1 Cell division protein FtsI [Peptidoglycan synthetase] [Helicobacter ailurogastricus]CRF52040.1 Cell division protein FtsI [Peptidoglycan synthetase] [Helicobacter ailurogastricus]BDQ29151.1 cell division protein FtsI [Helicobacter ailurogastricus]
MDHPLANPLKNPQNPSKPDGDPRRTERLMMIFIVVVGCFALFLVVMFFKALLPRKMPALVVTKTDIATRGQIYSQDGFSLANSQKLFKVSFNTLSIDPNKKEFFIDLLSIYTNIPKSVIAEKFNQSGFVTLSYNINANIAASLRQLNAKFLAYNVFKEYEDQNKKVMPKIGLSIEVSGIARNYIYKDNFEPLVGYIQKVDSGKITSVDGIKGIEKSKNAVLTPKNDGEMTGRRDLGFNLIEDKTFKDIPRVDGSDIVLSIPLKIQRELEQILDAAKTRYKAHQIIAGIYLPESGEILSLATTNRFNPNNIQKSDYSALNVDAIELSFEPGSTIKPIVYSLLVNKKRIDPGQLIDLGHGTYKLGKYTVRDDFIPSKHTTIEDVLIRSSNIGMIKLSKRLSGQELYTGLKDFGFAQKSGIDLPYEKTGLLPSVRLLNTDVYKGTASYGYGLRTTFLQLLRAYGVFVDGGRLATPHLVQRVINYPNGEMYATKYPPNKQVISPKSAQEMQNLLIKVVTKGTGKGAQVPGLVIGGKTGTARTAKKGKYTEIYTSSFFGFAKDRENTYVIGVVIFGSLGSTEYYAAQTAAPIFKQIVQMLVKNQYLTPTFSKH